LFSVLGLMDRCRGDDGGQVIIRQKEETGAVVAAQLLDG